MRFFSNLMASAAALAAVGAGLALTSCGGGGGGGDFGSDALVQLVTTSVPGGSTGEAYAAQFVAVFPHPPGKYLVRGGALPPGLRLDQDSGEVTGYPRQTGRFTYKISARDGSDPEIPQNRDATFAEDVKTFTTDIALGPPNFLPQTVPPAQYRASYGYFLDVAGGTAPYTFAQTGGTLPAGLTVAPDGKIGSFPTQAQQLPYEFDVTVTDALGVQDTEHFQLAVVVLPLLILTSQVPQAAQDFAYDFTLQLASLGAGVPITWSQLLPPGPGEVDLNSFGMEITGTGHLRNKAPATGPTTLGSHLFTARVTDEAGQIATRQYDLIVNPGPVLTSITPNKASSPGPYTATGLNFQSGVKLVFAPAVPSPSEIGTFTSANTTTLVFAGAPGVPSGATGYVTVRALNPDGGFFDLPNAYAFPAANLTFNSSRILPTPNSGLSSTGLDVADVNKDGFADIAHCGTNTSSWGSASGTTAGLDLMLNAPAGPGGTFDANNPVFTRIQLATSGDWHQVKFVDVNADGKLDVVGVGRVSGTSVIRTWINPYPAAFTAAMAFTQSTLPYAGAATLHVGDVGFGRLEASDLLPDLAYVHQDPASTVQTSGTWYGTSWYDDMGGSVSSVKGLGTGAFSSVNLDSLTIIPNIFSAGGVSLGNQNGDGVSDIVVSNQTVSEGSWNWGFQPQGNLGVVTMPGGGGLFGSWTLLKSNAPSTQYVEVLGTDQGDVTGDGKDDVLFSTAHDPPGNGSWGGTPTLATFQGSGSGTFTELASIKPSVRYRYVKIFDADFDQANDLAVTGGTTGNFTTIHVYKGRSGGLNPLLKVTLSNSGTNTGRVASGDISGDGRPDLVVANSFFADSQIRQYQGNGGVDRGNGGTMGVAIFLNTSN